MRYDAVLFDLDGTLIASGPGIIGSARHTVAQLGGPELDDATLQSFIGPSMYDSMRKHVGLSHEDALHAVEVYREHYRDHGVAGVTVYPGIPNLLRQLKAAGVYLAVATSKPIGAARRFLEHFGLHRFFDNIVGADLSSIETDKTALIRSALPARYERAAMVGDRRYDMEGAKKAGIYALGAGWGYGTPGELLSAGADLVCDTVADLGMALLGADAEPLRGFFISVEGLDGSGKTTQMEAVADHVRTRGYEVVMTREPGGTPIAEDIRKLVLDPDKTMRAHTEALLYAAARAEHVREVIRPALAKGRMVLCDRFVDSSIAFQGGGRELGLEPVSAINAFATRGTMPDLTLLLVVDARTAFLRRKSATALDRIERAGEAFYGRVYDAYAQLAKAQPERIRCIDARQSAAEVTRDVCQQIDRLLLTR